MPTALEVQIREANPWWISPDGLADDLHLRRYEASPVKWTPPVMEVMQLAFEDTHTLRGPRQAGKTTTLKLLIKGLIERGEQRVLYFSFDNAREAGAIGDVIRLAKQIHPNPKGRWYLFLDEVTSIPDWAYDVKHCWDSGLTADDAIVLTASSARDLRIGTERLPGRRGQGRDYLQLPMSFRDFCSVTGVELPKETVPAEIFLTEQGKKLASELFLRGERLQRAFAHYSVVGGFPSAVRDYLRSGSTELNPATLDTLWNTLAGDLSRLSRDSLAGLKLLEHVSRSLGSALKWTNAAEAMAVDSPMTSKVYAEIMSEIFVLLTVFHWDIGRKSLEPKKQRKIYFMDPLYAALVPTRIAGTPPPSDDSMVENIVASALFRSAALTIVQAGPIPGAIGYWRSTENREVDFVVPRVSDLKNPERLPIEVKGDNAAGLSGARIAIRKRFKNGLVLSRTQFNWDEAVPIMPVWAFLAGLKENMHRPVAFG